ncbi:MAG TPA: hypothetical protein VME40_12030 [Caulobacteraceae bacterium]|nr:hypothetical protein [Caulobacteraceae bacterium]
MTEQTDLFGDARGPAQLSFFGPGENQIQPPAQNFTPDPDSIRSRLRLILQKAQRAQTMPWPEREARMWQTVFPQMTNWLPPSEAEQLQLDFFREIERLKAA